MAGCLAFDPAWLCRLSPGRVACGGSILANTASVTIISFVALIVYAGLMIDWPSD